MNVRELIEALSALDQDLPVKIREEGWVPEEMYPPFERRFSDQPEADHVLFERKRK